MNVSPADGLGSRMKAVLSVMLVAALAACSPQMEFDPAGTSDGRTLAEQGIRLIPVTRANVAAYSAARMPLATASVRPSNPPADPVPYAYVIGPGDVLRIQAYTTPERTVSQGNVLAEGSVVDEAGRIYYPFIGAVPVAGLTAGQVRTIVTQRLRRFIADPQVEVTIEQFNSRSATILGNVSAPGDVALGNVPLRLLAAVTGAGVAEGDLRQVEIRRNGRTYIVNLAAYTQRGIAGQNPIILPGDVIFVPPLTNNKIFTFGEIGAGEIPLPPGGLSMTEVLAQRGGLNDQRSDVRGVFVFRDRPDTPQNGFDVFQFNLEDATTLVMAKDFAMQPLDIVFVTTDPVAEWNDTVARIISPLTSFFVLRQVPEQLAN